MSDCTHNPSAKNLEAIYHAIHWHNRFCRFGGVGVAVLMHPLEIERLGWAEGDDILGCELRADPEVSTGTFHIVCSREGEHRKEEAEEAIAEPPRVGEKVPVGGGVG